MGNRVEMERSFLIVTRRKDTTADHVLNRMAHREIPCIRLNVEDFEATDIVLCFPDIQNSILTIGDARIAFGDIRGVWLRRIAKPVIQNIQNPEAREFAESEIDFTLRWLIDLLVDYCPVLDRETCILEGRNKFSQLTMAEKFGFSIPGTIGLDPIYWTERSDCPKIIR